MGTYSDLSTNYEVNFGQNNQLATFPLNLYESQPPDRTEIFVCDLVNVDLPPSIEVDPQSVIVRFLASKADFNDLNLYNFSCTFTLLAFTNIVVAKSLHSSTYVCLRTEKELLISPCFSDPVAILNQDRELPNPAVINSFSFFIESGTGPGVQSLFLRCFSSSNNPELVWESTSVSSLSSGVITTEDSPFIDISYLEGINVDNRDAILRVSPINNETTGFYSCLSSNSLNSYTATVFTTQEQPFWRLTSPRILELPTGTTATIRALYADISDGSMNMGRGFDILLIFFPNDDRSQVNLVTIGSERSSFEFSHSFIVGGEDDSGEYRLTGEG